MGHAFPAVLDALAANDDFAEEALFTPMDDAGVAGETIALRALVSRVDLRVPVFRTAVRVPAWRATLRSRDVPARPKTNDHLTVLTGIFAGPYAVRDVREDPAGASYDLTLGEAPA